MVPRSSSALLGFLCLCLASLQVQQAAAKTRTYYISADEIDWKYGEGNKCFDGLGPEGEGVVPKETIDSMQDTSTIGGTYKKVGQLLYAMRKGACASLCMVAGITIFRVCLTPPYRSQQRRNCAFQNFYVRGNVPLQAQFRRYSANFEVKRHALADDGYLSIESRSLHALQCNIKLMMRAAHVT